MVRVTHFLFFLCVSSWKRESKNPKQWPKGAVGAFFSLTQFLCVCVFCVTAARTGVPSWAQDLSDWATEPDAALSNREDYLGWKHCPNRVLLRGRCVLGTKVWTVVIISTNSKGSVANLISNFSVQQTIGSFFEALLAVTLNRSILFIIHLFCM